MSGERKNLGKKRSARVSDILRIKTRISDTAGCPGGALARGQGQSPVGTITQDVRGDQQRRAVESIRTGNCAVMLLRRGESRLTGSWKGRKGISAFLPTLGLFPIPTFDIRHLSDLSSII